MPRARTPQVRGYRLAVFPAVHPTTAVRVTRIVLESAQSFATFQYELSVTATHSGGTIRFRVLGLKAPQNLLPMAGPARFVSDVEGLSGRVDLVFEGIDRKPILCTIDVRPAGVKIVKPPVSGRLSLLAADTHQHTTRAPHA